MYVLYQEKVRERMRVSVYSIQGVMEAPAAIYILSAISTSDMFSTSSVKACTSSNDIPSCIYSESTKVQNPRRNSYAVNSSYGAIYAHT